MEFLKTLAIACIPAIITGIITYIIACKNAKNEIKKIETEFSHKIELIDKTTSNNIAEKAFDKVFDKMLDSPEMEKRIAQSIRNTPTKRRRK